MRQAPTSSPALLLRQLLLLAFLAGVFASRYPAPALCGLGLLAVHQWRRFTAPGPRFAALFLALFAFCAALGAGYALWRAEPLPPLPEWARQAASPTERHLRLSAGGDAARGGPNGIWLAAENRIPAQGGGIEKDGLFRRGQRYRARVAAVDGRADRSLRLILENVQPLNGGAPYPGRVAFTWYRALTPEGVRPLPPDTPAHLRRPLAAPLLPSRPLPGDELELTLRLREVRGLKNPGLWDIEPYWADQGVGLRAWEQGEGPAPELARPGASRPDIWRERWRQGILAALPKAGEDLASGGELIPAMLFDDKYLMDSRDAELLARSTLAHSLALSGMHLGYAAAFGYAAALLLYRLCPGLAARLPRRKALFIGGALPALGYLWLGGAPPSLVRAAIMLGCLGWSLYRGKFQALADSLVLAVAAIALWEPTALFDLRLQLSALCMAALAWAAPLFSRVNAALRGPGPGFALWRRAALGAALLLLSSLVIQLALAPLLIKSFGLYGLAMPLNALWLPVLGAVVMPCVFMGLGAVMGGLPGLAALFFKAAVLPCGALLELLRFMDASGALPALFPLRPHWLGMLGFWFLLLLLPGQKAGRRPKLVLAASLIAVSLLLPEPPGVRLRLLDVGQGQAVLLEWGGRRLLVDGGGGGSPRFDVGREVVAATLAQNRLPRLDYMLASHLDADHAGGLVFVLRRVATGYYGDNGEPMRSGPGLELAALLAQRGLKRHALRAGDSLDLGGGLILEVLHPDLPPGEAPPGAPFDGNRNSLVLRLVWQRDGERRGLALICGDGDRFAQRALLRRLAAENGLKEGALRAEALVLPHHGAKSSLLPEFYAAVSPRLALASAAYYNAWNFPSPEVADALLEAGIPLLGTGRQGQIEVRWGGPAAAPQVFTARAGKLLLE